MAVSETTKNTNPQGMSLPEMPLVSIGMPIYNGEKFMHKAIESILNQTYQNIELIISDNCSSDGTEEICKSYAHKNSRIKYHRFDKNHGASRNFNQTFDLAGGKYFKWAAHDDYITEDYIEKCVQVLEKDPDICLCQTYKQIINEHGNEVERNDYKQLQFEGNNIFKNYLKFINIFRISQDDVDAVNGVFRRDILATTDLIANHNSSDFTLISDIVLKGKIVVLPEYLYYRRFHPGMSTKAYTTNAATTKYYDTSKVPSKISWPVYLWFKKFWKQVGKSNLTRWQKLVCHFNLICWLFFRAFDRIQNRLRKLRRKLY